jgi:glycosyltransferase involved in cell wall biosynthesis
VLNQAVEGVHYFAIGKSGYRHDRAAPVGAIREYLRAVQLLFRGIGVTNRQTVAYCHTTKFALPSLLLCRLFGVGQVVYFNHGVPYIGHRSLTRWALLLLERANTAAAHRFITVSPGMVGLLHPPSATQQWCHSTKPGSSSGLRETDFASLPVVRMRARAERKSSTRFLYAGRLQARKGVFVLLEAWKAHAANFPDDELWLCGFTPSELATHGAWAQLPQLKVMGYVEDMRDVYREVDVVVSPSFHEGFGYTLLEGAAQGCCIVSSAVPGPDVMFTRWMQPQLFAVGDCLALERVMAKLSGSMVTLAAGQLLSYRSAPHVRLEHSQ